MNLSTARSEKRAKEVGVRKAIGSLKKQLVFQFLAESIFVAFLSFLVALVIAQLCIPFFNNVSGKSLNISWSDPVFWSVGIILCLITGIIAGSYPAFYLSSFQPVKVLKGTFRLGRFASLPRKILVVIQFSVSVILIIGTVVIFRQIQFAKNRPLGYNNKGLIEIRMTNPELFKHYNALRNDLLKTGAIAGFSEASGPITEQGGGSTNITWKGKPEDYKPLLMANYVTHDYGETVDWQIIDGRDFSREYTADSSAMILNETALQLMNLKTPVNEMITLNNKEYRIIGIVRDMLKESPYASINPSFYIIDYDAVNTINIRLHPEQGAAASLAAVENVFKRYNPGSVFEYKFADQEFARKFIDEERIGSLSAYFAVLAILISCLGLFGVASFVAEQRTKEIGIRKTFGATVYNLWQLLSGEFVVLVLISLFIAIPVSWYFMANWLNNYTYRIELSWWIFAGAGITAILITILTVSFHSIKAAMTNPVRSLRTE